MADSSPNRGLSGLFTPLVYLSQNWISRIGVVLVTTTAVLWVLLLPTYMGGGHASAYMGIPLFVLLPTGFFVGLLLIPAGMLWMRKHGAPVAFPPLSWGSPELRKLFAFVAGTTIVNLAIGANLTYKGIEYMDSVEFCGTTCHTVMKPEYTAYQNSPHSRVNCVQCHIGPGASWFVKSKLDGTWQVISVTFNLYKRPIPTPIENLRPARETCEQCHWPEKYGTDRLRVIPQYDDNGTPSYNVLLMHIGGGNYAGQGIHGAHLGNGIRIRYAAADKTRQSIPWVQYSRNGQQRTFAAKDVGEAAPANMEQREMDCMDCHNRPSHAYKLPEKALDDALAVGELSRTLPEVKKQALAVIQKKYNTTAEAERDIPAAFAKFYQDNHPQLYAQRKAEVDASAKALYTVFSRNVFPEMNVQWGTYPLNIGHTDQMTGGGFPGCFRCHDGNHTAKDGQSITQDCNACHQLLAMGESDPKALQDLGIAERIKGMMAKRD